MGLLWRAAGGNFWLPASAALPPQVWDRFGISFIGVSGRFDRRCLAFDLGRFALRRLGMGGKGEQEGETARQETFVHEISEGRLRSAHRVADQRVLYDWQVLGKVQSEVAQHGRWQAGAGEQFLQAIGHGL